MLAKNINKNKYYLLPAFFTLLIAEISLVCFTGLELYKALILSLIIIFSVLTFLEPFYSLLLITFISFFIEGDYIQSYVIFSLYGFHWYLMDIAFLLSFLSISYRYFSGEYKLKINSTVVWIIVFYFACLIGTYWGLKAGHPAQDVFYDLRGFFYYLVFIPAAFLLEDFSNLKNIFLFILILGTVKCTIDTFSSLYFLPKTFDDTTWQYLPFARLKGYNEVVYPLTLIAGFTYFYFIKDIKVRLALLPTIFFSLTALFLSYTRGSWLAATLTFIIGVILLIRTQRLKIKISIFVITIISIIAVLFLLSLADIIPEKFLLARATSISLNKIDISNLGRLVEYATGFNEFLKSPFLGAGLGFKFVYFSPGIGTESTIYCHNSYLYVLTKMGLMGIIPFLFLLFSIFKVGPSILKSHLDSEEVGIVFGIILMIVVLSIKSLTTWHLNTVTFSSFVGILFGIAMIYKNKLRVFN